MKKIFPMIIGVFLVGCMTFKTGRPIDTSLISHIERGKGSPQNKV